MACGSCARLNKRGIQKMQIGIVDYSYLFIPMGEIN